MPGFFDFTDPNNAALWGAVSGLLRAGAPSRTPVPLGAALGNAGQAALRAAQLAYRNRAPAGWGRGDPFGGLGVPWMAPMPLGIPPGPAFGTFGPRLP